MSETTLVVCDLDGPLLDGRRRHHRCYTTILEAHGAQALALAPYWELKRSGADRHAQLAATGAEHLYDVFLAEWLERIEQPEMLALDTVQDGAVDALERWRGAGALVVLATHRRDHAALDAQLAATGLRPLLDEVAPSAPSGGAEGKAQAVLDKLEARPTRGAWIGDTSVDIAAARRLGLQAWAVSCGVRSAPVLDAAGPDVLAPNVASLPAL